MIEIWSKIENYPNYKISSFGRITNKKGKFLNPLLDRYGYYYVDLSNNGKQKKKKVHRLVALAFLSNPYNKLTVNHKDCNKFNNNVSNLEWATHDEQITHALRNKLFPAFNHEKRKPFIKKGIDIYNSKLTEIEVLEIRKSYVYKSVTLQTLADKYKVTKSTINCIIKKRTWKHI